ncbi:hypothetical protein HRJ34_04600 [Rhizorhabdus wittichii]|uniref:Lipoprotein n=1 Tax=Rhizorhabdus wittichii TaxID=160791 RepID=A0A975D4D6_9SPHN|nr:hypothetical protein [Rhizorhabdus wittichii]QTH22807.1 hypothetical protein HRJ34_04600 [Rhizorhabdus wittichii]
MKIRLIAMSMATALMLSACASTQKAREGATAAPPPPPPGAVPGNVAADATAAGCVDGYYSADGIYHPNLPPAPPPPPPPPTRRGGAGTC